ncbi:flagellar protein FlaG [Thiohalorhabdus methylotrophus]|uniref:Flagellar protein FlaG n=1 Tax=Thiohalorhabdus methylotrophus TaxID=3242694 RepID=A0ABV4TVX5_9GAMM
MPNFQPAQGGGENHSGAPAKPSGEGDSGPGASRQEGKEEQRPKAASLDEESLKEVQKRINEALDKLRFNLNFSIDREVDELVVKVVDPDTREVVREIPPEEMRELAKRMEEVTGILLDERR